MSKPLAGIKVLDLATMVLGPLAAQYLGDMGAEVIKVEPPEGDLMRQIGPCHTPGMGAFFLGNNRNKRSVVLDLKSRVGLEALYRLVRQSDVVIHSIRTAAADRLGISYADLSRENPRIIYCHVKGYSDEGLLGGSPAYDDVGQAQSGLADIQRAVAGEPRYVPSILADKVTALHAGFGVSVALCERMRTGVGQVIDVPMVETMAAFNVVEHLWGETFIPPLGPTGYVPVSSGSRRPFLTRDGRYICVLPYNEGHWRRFCEAVGDPDLINDPRYSTFAARQADQPGFWAEVGRRVATRDYDEWVELLGEQDVPFARVNSLDDLIQDPHLKSVGFWQVAEHETEGMMRMPMNPVRLGTDARFVHALPPLLGQHTGEVMREIGLSDEEIVLAESAGVFGSVDVRRQLG
ncbi:MAG: CoA transferase [Novosphingobium sp.]